MPPVCSAGVEIANGDKCGSSSFAFGVLEVLYTGFLEHCVAINLGGISHEPIFTLFLVPRIMGLFFSIKPVVFRKISKDPVSRVSFVFKSRDI
jgi:hypothetical protein